MNAKSSSLAVLSVFMVLFIICGCHAHNREPISLGYEWLRWTPEQRQLYVGGYLEGQGSQTELCDRFEYSVDNIKLHSDVRLEVNEAPCQHFVHKYTHNKVGSWDAYTRAYVSVIDDFYKHPECRMMPYSALMEHLDDKEYQSGDDLFRAVHSGRIGLGIFSGLEGTVACYRPVASEP